MVNRIAELGTNFTIKDEVTLQSRMRDEKGDHRKYSLNQEKNCFYTKSDCQSVVIKMSL